MSARELAQATMNARRPPSSATSADKSGSLLHMPSSALIPVPLSILWTDGSARDCDIGWGILYWRDGDPLVQTVAGGARLAVAPGHGSEVAEWYAVAEALKLLRSKKQPAWLLSDCQTVVDFVNGIADGDATNLDTYIARVGAHAFFQVGHAVAAFGHLRALKVKGHANSVGNVCADELAAKGRVALGSQKGTMTSAALLSEVVVLRGTGSTDYAALPQSTKGKSKSSSKKVAPHAVPKPVRVAAGQTPSMKLTPAIRRAIVAGMSIGLSAQEEQYVAAHGARLMQKAEALPTAKPAHRTKRNLALHRAKLSTNAMRTKMLEQKLQDAALGLLAERSER